MARQSKAEKQIDARIDRAYGRSCHGGINIMHLSKVYKVGREIIARGADDATLDIELRAFFDKIKEY